VILTVTFCLKHLLVLNKIIYLFILSHITPGNYFFNISLKHRILVGIINRGIFKLFYFSIFLFSLPKTRVVSLRILSAIQRQVKHFYFQNYLSFFENYFCFYNFFCFYPFLLTALNLFLKKLIFNPQFFNHFCFNYFLSAFVFSFFLVLRAALSCSTASPRINYNSTNQQQELLNESPPPPSARSRTSRKSDASLLGVVLINRQKASVASWGSPATAGQEMRAQREADSLDNRGLGSLIYFEV